MHKKLTITVAEDVYAGLYRVAGRGRISEFIESAVRPHLFTADMEAGYREMALGEEREREAREWIEGTVGDVANEPR